MMCFVNHHSPHNEAEDKEPLQLQCANTLSTGDTKREGGGATAGAARHYYGHQMLTRELVKLATATQIMTCNDCAFFPMTCSFFSYICFSLQVHSKCGQYTWTGEVQLRA